MNTSEAKKFSSALLEEREDKKRRNKGGNKRRTKSKHDEKKNGTQVPQNIRANPLANAPGRTQAARTSSARTPYLSTSALGNDAGRLSNFHGLFSPPLTVISFPICTAY